MKNKKLTHIGPTGEARMVDVSAKSVTSREARARGAVRMSPEALVQRYGYLVEGRTFVAG